MYLIYRYPHLLTANLINKVSNLEESGTSATSPATRTYIAELRAEFHSRSRERLEKLTSGVNPANFAAANQSSHGTGITIVKVGGTQGTNGVGGSGSSRSELNALFGVGQREIQTRSGSSTAAGGGGGGPVHRQPGGGGGQPRHQQELGGGHHTDLTEQEDDV